MNSIEIKKLLTNREIKSVIDLLKEDPSNGPSVFAAVLLLAEETKTKYKEKNISDKIFNNTMADITVWAENYRRKTGNCGIDELGWIMNHLNLELFALGRLQFMPSTFYIDNNWKKLSEFPLKAGENILEVHIPQNEPLLASECNISFKHAPVFFKNHFNYDFSYFTCHSWLLSPVLKEILPEDSNIIRFQNRFKIIAIDPHDKQAEERIFDKQFGSNTKSSLAIKVRELANKGITVGSGIGIIKKEDIL